jgi:ribosome maturation factor RimP
MDIVKDIEHLTEPVLAEAGLELVSLEWRRETVGWVLRFYLDKAGGFSLEDCSEWSRRLADMIEAAGLIAHAYSIEVSSPGINRPLRKRADFEKFLGVECILKTHEPINNQRNFRGKLSLLEGETLTLLDRSSGLVKIPLGAIAQAKLDPEIKLKDS